MFTLQLREAQISLKHKSIQHVRQFSSSELSPQLLTPSHLFDTCRHTRSFWQRKALVGGHWNFPEGEKRQQGNEKSWRQKIQPCNRQVCSHTHCTLRGSHQNCRHSRLHHRTSRPEVYIKCCCTGTRLEDSDVQLQIMERNSLFNVCAN